MHHIIYSSRAVRPFTDEELLYLLLDARRTNALHDISGVLVYGNGQFMQLIEGEETAITALYKRISQDPRHEQLVKYADKSIAARSFADWAMAFEPLSASQFDGLLSYLPAKRLAELAPSLSPADELLLQLMKDLVSRPKP